MVAIPLERLEGKYEILEKLQGGGMGAIYKVRHRLLGEVRVIKMIRPHLEQDPALKTRFLNEARAAARLSHPNIAHLYDYTVDEDGAAFIVMEFIPGLTLGELLAGGELLPVGLALEIARQALRAIGHVHRHGIVHRDVSPDNLMLTTDVDGRPLVKLLDLGLIKTVDGTGAGSRLTAAGVFVGKFRYAAPEQFDEPAQAAPGEDRRRGDLYSLAVVLYELLTGRYPIAGDSPSSLIAGHLFRPPLDFAESDPEGRVPETVRRAVFKGLAKKPAARFASADDFAAALDAGVPLDLESPAVERILELVRRQALPRLAPAPPRGSTQSRLDREFAAEPTPPPGEETAAVPTLVREAVRRPAVRRSAVRRAGSRTPGVEGTEAAPETRILPQAPRSPAPAAEPVRATDEVERAAPAVEALIENGDFAGARSRLRELAAAAPGHPRLAELLARLDEVEEIANRPRVRELLRKAQREAERDRHEAAVTELRRAAELAPREDHVRSLLAAAERELRRHREVAERERAVAERADRVAGLLDRGELGEAAGALWQAVASLGGHPRFRELRRRLETLEAAAEARRRGPHAAGDEIRQLLDGGEIEAVAGRLPEALEVAGPTAVLRNLQAQVTKEMGAAGKRRRDRQVSRRERADRLVAEARSRASADELTAARDLLHQALALAPDHPEGLTLQTSVEACLRVREEELRQVEEVERTAVGIRALLDQGRPAEALASLGRAATRLGDHKELQTLRYEAAQARLDEADRAASEPPGAEPSASAPPAAEPSATPPSATPPSASEPSGPAAPALDQLTLRIRALTSDGRTGEALRTLQHAIHEHGQLGVLQELGTRSGWRCSSATPTRRPAAVAGPPSDQPPRKASRRRRGRTRRRS